jgi:hypothetical protein
MSLERRHIMRAYGAEIALTPASDGMLAAVRHAEKLVRETPGAFMPSQFDNPANPASHYTGTANELIEQLAGRIDVFVAGVGTGGTITGVARCLRERLDKVHVVAVEPKSSPVLSGGKPGLHAIQGLGAGFIPSILDRSVSTRSSRCPTSRRNVPRAGSHSRRASWWAPRRAPTCTWPATSRSACPPGISSRSYAIPASVIYSEARHPADRRDGRPAPAVAG